MSGPRRDAPRARAVLVLFLALSLTPGVEGAVGIAVPDSTLRLDGVVIPVTFAAGLTGTTTLGVNRTYAETEVPEAATLISANSLVNVESRTLREQYTFMRFNSITGLPRIIEAKIAFGTTTQVHIQNGEVLQSEGISVPLAPGTSLTAGGDLKIEKGQNAHMTIDVVSRDARGITLVETWVLYLRG